MIAWALSGGGNRGPIEVGAMRALFEAGIIPQILVGTSAGALNSAFLASDPTAAGVERLAQIWLKTKKQDIFPEGLLTHIINFILGKDGLNSGEAVRNYFIKNMPPGIETFGDLKVKLYLTTGDLQTGQLFLFGDDPQGRILDGVLSSTALPVAWPPQVFNGHQFVDGAVVADVPITIAVDKGADTIYALDLSFAGPYPLQHGVYNIGLHSVRVLERQQLLRDLLRVIKVSNVTLHHIYLGDIFDGVPIEDFSHTAEMIEQGYQRTKDYLAHPTPNQISRPKAFATGAPVGPPGAVPYVPPL
jgi:NTE family protein